MEVDGFSDGRIDLEAEPRGERDGTQHADGILLKAELRIADRSDDPPSQIVYAVHVVDDREGSDVVEKRVDREIAAEGVFLWRAERILLVERIMGRRHTVRDDLFARLNLPPERGDLDHLRLRTSRARGGSGGR